MCGIAGLMAKTITDPFIHNAPDALRVMLRDIESRGRDATGIAWWDDSPLGKRLFIDKEPINASRFITRHEPIIDQAAATGLVIAHTRYPTKGDLNIPCNNHPIDTNTIVGVHNGGVYNDDEIFSAKNLERRGQVDSEAIFALLSAQDVISRAESPADRTTAFAHTLADVQGSMAIAFMSKFEENVLYLAKGSGSPLISAESVDGTFLFASTQGAVASAHRMLGGGDIKFRHHDTGDVTRIDATEILRRKIPYPIKVVTPKTDTTKAHATNAPTLTVTPVRKPCGTTADRFSWIDTTEENLQAVPQLSDMDAWTVFNEVGAVPFVGCFAEEDQAQVLGALAHNLFMDPTQRVPANDLAQSQFHLRAAVEYIYAWLHDDKDTRKFSTVMGTVYDRLGSHMVGEYVRWKPTSTPKGESTEVRIVGFGQGETYSAFPNGPRVFVQYKQAGDTVVRSVAKSTLNPLDTKPGSLHEKRLGWFEDAALALSYCDDANQIHPLHQWLDPSEPIDLNTLKAAVAKAPKTMSPPEDEPVPLAYHCGYL